MSAAVPVIRYVDARAPERSRDSSARYAVDDTAADEIRRTRYGNSRYRVSTGSSNRLDYAAIRQASREIYFESSIAQGIVGRSLDTVVNTGLSWQSLPAWDLLAEPVEPERRYAWTRRVESLWSVYARSTDADISRQLTFQQWQRLAYRLALVEGEIFVLFRYFTGSDRVSPLALQILNPDQICDPWGEQRRVAEARGHRIEHGIEHDREGVPVAIYVREPKAKGAKRIPFFGQGGRRFVLHYANRETAGQSRGLAELSARAYELNRLTEYDTGELEATVSSAQFFGVVESALGSQANRGPNFGTLGPRRSQSETPAVAPGMQQYRIGGRSIVLNNLQPGYTFKGFEPKRPNPNYEAFVSAHESRITNSFGMPHSVFRQSFSTAYTAARMEVVSYWHNVNVRRGDFVAGVLEPIKDAWFAEEVAAGRVIAPGYFASLYDRLAWSAGLWNGIARPSVDPQKEADAVERRLRMGHTTNAIESRIYNGSDFRENAAQLRLSLIHI